MQRQAAHFEILLGLLKMLFSDVRAGRPTPPEWLAKTAWAIARGEAILDGARGPDGPTDLPAPRHALAELHEDRVRDQVASILEADDSFAGLTVDEVTDTDIHAGCLSVAASTDLAEEVGGAEFRAALAALRQAQLRSA
ncbi:hypothetical protein [Mesorhizobium sp.]|uniref:hypothetical protein n=1 Tax=Mesorhizobium sp. TaxID=1871066 RepID=UPI00338D74B1